MGDLEHKLDMRLERIEALLEEGNQHARDTRLEMQEEMETLNHKVDNVKDTVMYIKKHMSTMTPYRLACALLFALVLWIFTVHYLITRHYL